MSTHLRTPLKNARGLGSAKSGVSHWVVQRLTALALVVLGVWFTILVLNLLHADYFTARATIGQPLNAIFMTAFVVALFWHTQLGLQVVIEDYIHTRWLEVFLQIVIKFLCLFGALASIFSITHIALRP